MKHTITLSQLTCCTYSVKDNSVRGCHTAYRDDLHVGDKVLIDNYFHEIIDEPVTEEEHNTMTKEELTNAIIEYFENNEEVFTACIEELDNYNGYLNDNRCYEMEMLKEFYTGTEPLELLNRAFFGHDDDTWTTDANGIKTYGAFDPNREYFYYNGYGNLISSNYKDYSAYLDSYFVEALNENRQYIDSIDDNDELKQLFDKLEELEND